MAGRRPETAGTTLLLLLVLQGLVGASGAAGRRAPRRAHTTPTRPTSHSRARLQLARAPAVELVRLRHHAHGSALAAAVHGVANRAVSSVCVEHSECEPFGQCVDGHCKCNGCYSGAGCRDTCNGHGTCVAGAGGPGTDACECKGACWGGERCEDECGGKGGCSDPKGDDGVCSCEQGCFGGSECGRSPLPAARRRPPAATAAAHARCRTAAWASTGQTPPLLLLLVQIKSARGTVPARCRTPKPDKACAPAPGATRGRLATRCATRTANATARPGHAHVRAATRARPARRAAADTAYATSTPPSANASRPGRKCTGWWRARRGRYAEGAERRGAWRGRRSVARTG